MPKAMKRLLRLRMSPDSSPSQPEPAGWTRDRVIEALRAHVVGGGRPAAAELRRVSRALYAAIVEFGGVEQVRQWAGLDLVLPPRDPQRRRYPRLGEVWLQGARGGRYAVERLARAVGFRVLHQSAEGRLWITVLVAQEPLVVPLYVTRTELENKIGHRAGAYHLVPVDEHGERVGDPPQIVFVPDPRLPGQPGPGAPRRDSPP